MTESTWTLMDADAGIFRDRWEIGPSSTMQLAGAPDWFVRTFPLVGGQSTGVHIVEVSNGPLSLRLLPTRGMGVWDGRLRGLALRWQSPVPRPVHPAFVNPAERGGLGWLNGFNELMCRCGLAFNGPPGQDGGDTLTLHGRIANLPAHFVEVRIDNTGPGTITVRGIVDETTMFGPCWRLTSTLRMTAGTNRVEFMDEMTNLGARPAELSLLYHINIGSPILENGARNIVPHQELVPRDARAAEGLSNHELYEGPTAGYAEQGFLYKPAAQADGWSTALLHNQAGTAAFAIDYNTRQLPWFTVWKNTMANEEGYVTGLEPGINIPNFRSFERAQGRLPQVAAGETYRAEFAWEIADNAVDVARLQTRARQIQASVKPRVHVSPQQGWSPAGTPIKTE